MWLVYNQVSNLHHNKINSNNHSQQSSISKSAHSLSLNRHFYAFTLYIALVLQIWNYNINILQFRSIFNAIILQKIIILHYHNYLKVLEKSRPRHENGDHMMKWFRVVERMKFYKQVKLNLFSCCHD